MLLLYNLALQLYALLARLAAPFVPKAAAWTAGQRGLLAHIRQRLGPDPAPRLWMHCASLGEFEQGRPLLEALRKRRPDLKIVLTFFSPSGYAVRHDWRGADYVFYLPLDSAAHARAFLDAMRPELAFFVKYEFWHHYLHELRRRDVPTVAVAAIFRPGQTFFQPWGGFFRRMLGCFTHIFTQNEASAALLRGIGLGGRVQVAGDTRFDTVVATATARPRALPLLDAFVSDWAPVLVVGSSWPEDLAVLTPLLRRYQADLRFLVAPHEISEAGLQAVEAALPGPGQVLRYSRATPETAAAARLLLIDNVGLLAQLYRYGHFAYVGGAFGKGLHNTLEAAAFGLPLFFGPHYAKFQEAVELVELGCAFPVRTAAELQAAFGRLHADETARLVVQDQALDYVHEHAGATARILRGLGVMS